MLIFVTPAQTTAPHGTCHVAGARTPVSAHVSATIKYLVLLVGGYQRAEDAACLGVVDFLVPSGKQRESRSIQERISGVGLLGDAT
jgi:hypothetical protein